MQRFLGFILVLGLVSCAQPPAIRPALPPPSEPSADLAPPFQPQASWDTGWRMQCQQVQNLSHLASWSRCTVSGREGEVEVCQVRFDSRHCTLRVVDQPDAAAGSGALREAMRSVNAIAGVNGGYFHPDFTPLGLMIADGRSSGQWVRTSLVSGMLRVRQGVPALIWNHEPGQTLEVEHLLQSGPRLVDAGRVVEGLNGRRSAARTFIATDGSTGWLVGVARNVTLQGLAEILATPGLLCGFRIERALNFDGGRSTAFYVRQEDGSEVAEPGWSTVRNYVAVVPR